jgi:hypothetical protein
MTISALQTRHGLRAHLTQLDPCLDRSRPDQSGTAHRSEHPMLDVVMLAIALGFFVLSVGYTIACDRL